MTPTQTTLRLIGQHANVSNLLAWARAPREIALIMPRVGSGHQGMRPRSAHFKV